MFTFLGKGGAFDIQRGNTAGFLKKGTTLYLVDCGEDVFNKLIRYDVLNNIGNIFVFITHLHSDNIGSLTTLMNLLHFTQTTNLTIIYPNTEKLTKITELMGCDYEKKIITPLEYNQLDNDLKCEVVEHSLTSHDENIFSYGYYFYIDDKTIYYSGNCASINSDALRKLKAKKIDYFYQEATLDGLVNHTNLSEINKKITKKLRDRVFLMRINLVTENQAKKLGFQIVETIDDFDFEAEDGQSCLIIGPLTNAEQSQINKYKKLATFCKKHFKEVLTPLQTMKFGGSPTEKYKRAIKMIGDASIVIADVSEPSTGTGMELFRVKQVRKKVIIIAQKKAKVSSLVQGMFGSEKIIYYSSTADLIRQLEKILIA